MSISLTFGGARLLKFKSTSAKFAIGIPSHSPLRGYIRTATTMVAASLSVNTAQANFANTTIHENNSQSSLPDSPTSILTGTKSGRKVDYTAPPIPRSFRDSVGAYFRKTDSAAPELYLYRYTGYFQGATLRNAPNTDLFKAFQSVQTTDAKSHLQANLDDSLTKEKERATIGTQLNSDGKVGSIRSIDIGSKHDGSGGLSSWFTSPIPKLINMLEIGTPRPIEEIRADDQEEKVVLLHGYGAGTAFFFQNLKSLAGHPQSRLYALDWLGMGRSSRVPFHITSKDAKTTETRVEAAESFFVQALEDWRKTMGLKKMTLIGHSLGGYLSIAYSLKYPQHVNRLVLLSPAGIPEPRQEDMGGEQSGSETKPADRKDADRIADEVQQSQKDVAPSTSIQSQNDIKNTVNAASRTKARGSSEVQERIQYVRSSDDDEEEVSTGKRPIPPPKISSRRRNMIQFLWEQNLSPFAILRSSWIFGPMLAGGYTSRRFASLPDEKLRALHAYCYDIFTSRGSSEYCLAHILARFGYARSPMVNRITGLPKSLPVTFIYGERGIDWMDEEGGKLSVERLAKAGNPHARCFAVPHAGHHVYLDNPGAFDTLLGKVLRGQVDDAGKAGEKA